MRERFKAEPAEVVCKYLFRPAIMDDNRRSFKNMSDINIAHALMLDREKIIPHEDAQKLLQGLLRLEEKGPEALTLDPKLEDYYFNIEQNLIADIGIDIAGRLHTGRSRNDLQSTLVRMNIRDEVARLIPLVFELRKKIIKLADENKETVLTGYTHMQPAQPISLSYYFCAIAEAIERDYQRIFAAFNRMNYSTLGGGAFAGTSFPIDREFTARKLGFNGPVYSALDGVASRDYVLELTGVFAILGSTINRFANDLYIWTTDEFGYIEVDDSVAACSSIMPQKKNPITLEHIRAKTSHLLSGFVSVFGTLKGAHFGHSREVSETFTMFWESARQLEIILELLNATLETLKVKKEGMEDKARKNFCVVTEIADELVKTENIPFRVAHKIVGNLVRMCLDAGLDSSQITTALVNEATKEVTGKETSWSEEHATEVLSPSGSIHGKLSMGGPSPKECGIMTGRLSSGLDKDRAEFQEKISHFAKEREALHEEARAASKS